MEREQQRGPTSARVRHRPPLLVEERGADLGDLPLLLRPRLPPALPPPLGGVAAAWLACMASAGRPPRAAACTHGQGSPSQPLTS